MPSAYLLCCLPFVLTIHNYGVRDAIFVRDTDHLEAAPDVVLDPAPFGIIGFGHDGIVDLYNAAESRMAGLSPDKVVGKHFFGTVAPCMNNYLVAQRFEDEQSLDVEIDYVLTPRMRPTPVKLRLLKAADADRRYVLVQRS